MSVNEIQRPMDGSLQASRRGFLTVAGRTAALVALGGLGAVLVFKRTCLPREEGCMDPAEQSQCRRCGVYATCSLPRAVSAKRDAETKHG
jgi:hypothetical protein